MADFTSNVSPVNVPNEPMLTNPVDTSAANNISALGNILGTVGSSLVQGYTQNQQLAQTKNNFSHIEQYTQNLLRINDLEQQGIMKPEQAMRRYRLLTAQTLSNHPTLREDILKTYNAVIGAPGLGKETIDDVERTKNNQNALEMAAKQSALQAGFITTDMSPEQQDVMVQKHQQFLFGQTQMEQASKLLAYKTSEINLTNAGLETQLKRQSLTTGGINQRKAALELSKAQAQSTFLNGAQHLADSYYSLADNNSQKIISKVGTQIQDPNTGKPTVYTKDMAVVDLKAMMTSMQNQATAVATGYDQQGSIGGLIKPSSDLVQIKIDQLIGKISTDVATQQLSQSMALQQQMIATKDPDFIKYAAISKTLPAGMQQLVVPIANAAVKSLQQNGLIPDPDNPNGTKPADLTNGKDDDSVNQHLSVIKGAIKTIQQGVGDQGLKDETKQHMDSILKGISKYAPTTDSPAELNSLMSFLADATTGKYLRENPDLIAGDSVNQAKDALQVYYKSKVRPLIRDEFEQATVPIGVRNVADNNPALIARFGVIPGADQREVPSEIHMIFNGTGASFVAVSNADQPVVQQKVKDLNKTLAPVINTMIKTDAHLDGSQSYKKAYQALTFDIFGAQNMDADQKPVGTEGDISGL